MLQTVRDYGKRVQSKHGGYSSQILLKIRETGILRTCGRGMWFREVRGVRVGPGVPGALFGPSSYFVFARSSSSSRCMPCRALYSSVATHARYSLICLYRVGSAFKRCTSSWFEDGYADGDSDVCWLRGWGELECGALARTPSTCSFSLGVRRLMPSSTCNTTMISCSYTRTFR